MRWQDRREKQITRQLTFENYHQRHTAVFLPGYCHETGVAGECVREGLSMGALQPALPIRGAEYDPYLAPLIEQSMGDLSLVDFSLHHGELAKMPIDATVDLAFIDLMGSLDPSLLRWVRDSLAPHLTNDARLAFVVPYAPRASTLMYQARVVFERIFPQIVAHAVTHFNISDLNILLPFLLIRCALNEYDIALTKRAKYRDSRVSMVYFRIDGICRVYEPTGWPQLAEVLELCRKVPVVREDGKPRAEWDDHTGTFRPQRKREDLQAALNARLRTYGMGLMGLTLLSPNGSPIKDYDTLDEIEQQFPALPDGENCFSNCGHTKGEDMATTEAAHKAWATRRANEEQRAKDDAASLRSEAAKKAWRTRRANGWVHPARRRMP